MGIPAALVWNLLLLLPLISRDAAAQTAEQLRYEEGSGPINESLFIPWCEIFYTTCESGLWNLHQSSVFNGSTAIVVFPVMCLRMVRVLRKKACVRTPFSSDTCSICHKLSRMAQFDDIAASLLVLVQFCHSGVSIVFFDVSSLCHAVK